MELDQALTSLQAHECRDALAKDWQAAMAAMPATINFLQREVIREYCTWCSLHADKEAELVEVAGRVWADEALRAFAWYCHWRLFGSASDEAPGAWPTLDAKLGQQAGVFYMLIGLSLVGPMRLYHTSLDIPESVTRETCLQIDCYSGNWERAHEGQIGMYVPQLQWLRFYVRKPFLRLGRMEFETATHRGGIVLFRHRESRAVVGLVEDGVRFNAAGYVARQDLDADAPDSWTATFSMDETSATGHMISPLGMAAQQQVTLPLSAWECVLQKDTPVLSMHIPAGGSMTPEACADSFQRAAAFFPKHFPNHKAAVITCSSWLFNTQLEEIMKPDSNLLKLQHELYLYPVPSSGTDGLWFIFLQDEFNVKTAPRDTSLRRSILEYIEAGNPWRGGGMLYLLDDADRYGTQPYRSHWPPAGLSD